MLLLLIILLLVLGLGGGYYGRNRWGYGGGAGVGIGTDIGRSPHSLHAWGIPLGGSGYASAPRVSPRGAVALFHFTAQYAALPT